MKVSLNWIKDYVDLPQDMDLTRLAYDLTMSTVEVEGAEDLARRTMMCPAMLSESKAWVGWPVASIT